MPPNKIAGDEPPSDDGESADSLLVFRVVCGYHFARRRKVGRHGASQTGCWPNVMIWMTERSGSAPRTGVAKAASTNRQKKFFTT